MIFAADTAWKAVVSSLVAAILTYTYFVHTRSSHGAKEFSTSYSIPQKIPLVNKGYFLWCRWSESNRYGVSPDRFWVCCVCQFHHSGISSKHIWLYYIRFENASNFNSLLEKFFIFFRLFRRDSCRSRCSYRISWYRWFQWCGCRRYSSIPGRARSRAYSP